MANRYEVIHAQGRGTLSLRQEIFLRNQRRETLAKYRAELGIFEPIPRLSARQAWRLINRISQDTNGGAA